MSESSTITIRLDSKILQKFKKYCENEKYTMSSLLRDYIKDKISWIEVDAQEYFLDYLSDNGKELYLNLQHLCTDLKLSRYQLEKNRQLIYQIYYRDKKSDCLRKKKFDGITI